MLIFAVDTALQRCSVAIMRGGDVLAVEIEDRDKGHAERIAPMADAAFRTAGVSPKELDRVGVVIGPGGFTGVRVALAFARAMGLATGAGVVGVASTEALAANVATGDAIAGVIDARRQQVYAGIYKAGRCPLAPFVAAPEEAAARIADAAVGPVTLVGSGVSLLPLRASWTVSSADPQIDPLAVARLAAAAPAPSAMPAPLYLRPPDAKPPKR